MRLIATSLIISLFTFSPGNVFAQDNIQWRSVATSIPLGSKVRVQTTDGKRISGTLVRVDDTTMQVKRNARRPEAALAIALDNVSNIERDHGGGLSWGTAVAIGLGVGAGAILTIFVIALQLD